MINKNFISVFKRFKLGVKKGIFTPTLPQNIIILQQNVFIRFLRVMGGFSMILIISNRLYSLGTGLLFSICMSICIFFSLIFSLYLFFISYHRIKYMIKVLKSDDLDIRNSPLDRFASLATRIIWCSKGFCEVAAPIGVTYGGMAGLDELRKMKGLEPIFLPWLADIILPTSESQKVMIDQRNLESRLIRNNQEFKFYDEEMFIIKKLEENKIINKIEGDEWRNDIKYNSSMLNQESKTMKSKILSNIEKLNEIRNKK